MTTAIAPLGRRARLAVMLSGRGSNFVAIADACAKGEIDGEVVQVATDHATAAGRERARERGIPTVVFERRGFPTREAHDQAIADALAASKADLVCLAGYMRILGPAVIDRWAWRMVNIHPSLLPAFPGLHAQRQALDAGVKVSGCTVHFVDGGLDSGPILAQRSVPVLPDDDEAALSARILEHEHGLYVAAIRDLLARGGAVDGRVFRYGG